MSLPASPNSPRPPSARPRVMPRTQRGMALLMVMIGLVVCSILTAGFLSTQGTSIGIARNERDASKCRGIAQTGIDMCYWQIRKRSDWREAMRTGTWLTSMPVGDGTVTTSVADGAGHSSFSTDPTQAAVVTSTGTYDNRTLTLVATIQPTGSGTVFASGNFISGNIQLGNSLLTAAQIDSYNSSVAAYSTSSAGSNGSFGSDATAAGALLIYFPSIFNGTYTAAPSTLLTNILSLVGLASSPTAVATATEFRTPGAVIMPNISGLAYNGAYTKSNSSGQVISTPGRYDSITLTNSSATINTSGLYYVTGNLSVSNATSSSLAIADGKTVVLVVNGSVSISKALSLGPTSQLAIYSSGTVTLSGTINGSTATNHLVIFGSSSCNSIQITGTNTAVYGAIYAPQAALTMQTGNPKFYGAVVANSLGILNSSQLHFDQALQSLYLSNLTGGSAAPGTADYRVTIAGGPGIGH